MTDKGAEISKSRIKFLLLQSISKVTTHLSIDKSDPRGATQSFFQVGVGTGQPRFPKCGACELIITFERGLVN